MLINCLSGTSLVTKSPQGCNLLPRIFNKQGVVLSETLTPVPCLEFPTRSDSFAFCALGNFYTARRNFVSHLAYLYEKRATGTFFTEFLLPAGEGVFKVLCVNIRWVGLSVPPHPGPSPPRGRGRIIKMNSVPLTLALCLEIGPARRARDGYTQSLYLKPSCLRRFIVSFNCSSLATAESLKNPSPF